MPPAAATPEEEDELCVCFITAGPITKLCAGTREEPGTLTQGAPVFPGSSRLGIEPKTPGWLVQVQPPGQRRFSSPLWNKILLMTTRKVEDNQQRLSLLFWLSSTFLVVLKFLKKTNTSKDEQKQMSGFDAVDG